MLQGAAQGTLRKKKRLGNEMKSSLSLLVLTLPALIYFLIWHYAPMFGLIIAFKDYSYELGILGSRWIGFDNFKFFFLSQDAWRITRNTVGYGALFIIVDAVTAVGMALLMNEVKSRAAIKTYQTIMLFPQFLSWVVVGFITYILLNPALGIFNKGLEAIGLKGIDWFSEPKYWPYILTLVHIWKSIGMNMIMYYAALLGINHELYEAATLDGANRLQQCWYISIPALIPLITMLSILAVGNIFRGDFGLFYQIPRDVGVLYPTTDVIDTYVYRGLKNGDMGTTSAVGFFQSVVGLAMVLITNWIVKKIEPENAMF